MDEHPGRDSGQRRCDLRRRRVHGVVGGTAARRAPLRRRLVAGAGQPLAHASRRNGWPGVPTPIYTAETHPGAEPPPAGFALDGATWPRWAMAQYIWRFLRRQKIDLAGRKSLVPEQRSRVRPQGGRDRRPQLAPAGGRHRLAVIEPHIQARAPRAIWLPNGRALIGHGHTRHGTTTLFAALSPAARFRPDTTNGGAAVSSSTS